MTGPAFTSLSTLHVDSVRFEVAADRIVTRTMLTDQFGVDFAFSGSPQDWVDFGMRVAKEIYLHASRLTDEQLDGLPAADPPGGPYCPSCRHWEVGHDADGCGLHGCSCMARKAVTS